MVTSLRLGIAKVVTGTCRNGPPICVALILPIGVACIGGKTEDHLVAVIVVPVESSVPTVGNLVFSVFTVDNLLCHLGTLVVFAYPYVGLGIEIQAYKKGCRTCLRPLSLYGGVGTELALFYKHRDNILQFGLDEGKELVGGYLSLGVERDIVVANGKWHIAERIEKADIEPCTQGTALGLQIIELCLREAEFVR